jgi:hypothetical protein
MWQSFFSAPAPSLVEVPATLFEQWVALLTGVVVKPLYMILSYGVARKLRGPRARDLTLIRQAMWVFLVGEIACALRFAELAPLGCDPLETIHVTGMVVMGGLLAWGMVEFLDKRILNTSEAGKPCGLLRLCGGCWKQQAVACPLFRIARVSLPMFIVLSCIPLVAPLAPAWIRYPVLGTPVIDETPVFIALLQARVFPLLGMLLFGVAWWRMRRGPGEMDRAKAPYFLGLGCLVYALFVFFLRGSFGPKVYWGNAWEELTELFSIVTVVYFVRLFGPALGLGKPVAPHA